MYLDPSGHAEMSILGALQYALDKVEEVGEWLEAYHKKLAGDVNGLFGAVSKNEAAMIMAAKSMGLIAAGATLSIIGAPILAATCIGAGLAIGLTEVQDFIQDGVYNQSAAKMEYNRINDNRPSYTAGEILTTPIRLAKTPSPEKTPLPVPAPSPDSVDLDPNQINGFEVVFKALSIFWKSLEIETSVGFGIGAAAKAVGLGLSLQARSDFLVIALDDGKFDIARRQSAEIGIAYLATDSTYYGQDYQSYITGEMTMGETGWKNTIPIVDIGGYLLVGGEISINFNPDDFLDLIGAK